MKSALVVVLFIFQHHCSCKDLGMAVIRAIKISKKAPKVGEEMLSAYWKQTKYKGFMAFSKHFQSMHIRVIGNELQIKRWIADKKGYVPASDEEARMVSMKVTPYELGVFIKKMFSIVDQLMQIAGIVKNIDQKEQQRGQDRYGYERNN